MVSVCCSEGAREATEIQMVQIPDGNGLLSRRASCHARSRNTDTGR